MHNESTFVSDQGSWNVVFLAKMVDANFMKIYEVQITHCNLAKKKKKKKKKKKIQK